MHDNRHFPSLAPTLRLAGAAALALTLVACNKSGDEATLGQKLDSAISQTEKKADELRDKAEGAADNAQASADQAATDARTSVNEAASTVGDKIDDAAITAAVSARLAGDSELSALKINVDTQAGKVTLSGPAPTEAARARAAELATSVKGVVGIQNNLVVEAG